MKIVTIFFSDCKNFKDYMFTKATLEFFQSIDDGVLNLQDFGGNIRMEYKIDEHVGVTSEDLKLFCTILGSKKYTIF